MLLVDGAEADPDCPPAFAVAVGDVRAAGSVVVRVESFPGTVELGTEPLTGFAVDPLRFGNAD
jgi:hypothetical protein